MEAFCQFLTNGECNVLQNVMNKSHTHNGSKKKREKERETGFHSEILITSEDYFNSLSFFFNSLAGENLPAHFSMQTLAASFLLYEPIRSSKVKGTGSEKFLLRFQNKKAGSSVG